MMESPGHYNAEKSLDERAAETHLRLCRDALVSLANKFTAFARGHQPRLPESPPVQLWSALHYALHAVEPLPMVEHSTRLWLYHRMSSEAAVLLRRHPPHLDVHSAARRGLSGSLCLMHSLGVSIDVPNTVGQTPLHAASEQGHAAVVRLLHGLGASIDRPDRVAQTPLHAASGQGHAAMVHLLHGLGANIETPNFLGRTPLYGASERGHTATVLLLHRLGANVNAPDDYSWTPLYAASGRDTLQQRNCCTA